MLNNIAITLDIDWAPDLIIQQIAKILINKNVKATWFITHDSEQIQTLFKYPELFEVGIHPNFKKNSSQGESPEKIIDFLLNIAPKAKSVRTHSLYQSTPILKLLKNKGLKNDVSIFLSHAQNITPTEYFFSQYDCISRFPFLWEDDEEINRLNPCFNPKKFVTQKGLKIFNFHPIHIFMNSCVNSTYENIKHLLNPFNSNDLKPFINKNPGVGTFFQELVNFLEKNKDANTISEISDQWDKLNPRA